MDLFRALRSNQAECDRYFGTLGSITLSRRLRRPEPHADQPAMPQIIVLPGR
jgi:hypothetical protein